MPSSTGYTTHESQQAIGVTLLRAFVFVPLESVPSGRRNFRRRSRCIPPCHPSAERSVSSTQLHSRTPGSVVSCPERCFPFVDAPLRTYSGLPCILFSFPVTFSSHSQSNVLLTSSAGVGAVPDLQGQTTVCCSKRIISFRVVSRAEGEFLPAPPSGCKPIVCSEVPTSEHSSAAK